MSPKVLMFHIYIKVRRILFEMGGIQSESALPGDPTFSRIQNNYGTPSFKRICRISPSADFRFKGENHGLGSVSVYVSYVGPEADHSTAYPEKNSAMRVEKLLKEFFCFHGHYFHRYSVIFLLHNFSLFVSFRSTV